MQWWNLVDKIIFINLDHRTDRLENMQRFFTEARIPSEKIVRFSAIRETPGIVGAARSHIAVMKMIIYHGWENVLILEDDVQGLNYSNETLIEHIKKPFDVLMLGGYYSILEENRAIRAFQTSSYIIKKYYVPKLLDNFEIGLKKLLSNKFSLFQTKKNEMIKHDNSNHIDVYWWKLQQIDNWRCIVPPMVIQKESYSDIQEKTVKGNNYVLSPELQLSEYNDKLKENFWWYNKFIR
jgi:glycosyl transferase family 25